MWQVCVKELLWDLLLRLIIPRLLYLLAVRPHLYQHFSDLLRNLRPRYALDAGIDSKEVLDHEGVPMDHEELFRYGCYHI